VSGAGQALERQRQRLLLQALWQRRPDADLAAWLREDGARLGAGIAAYRTNAASTACRALAAAYPVLAELVGPACFDSLAQACWLAHPPQCGDLGRYGEALIDLVQAWIDDPQRLAEEPYLADVARLEWWVHQCDAAADAVHAASSPIPGLPDADGHAQVPGLALLAGESAEAATLVLRQGTAVWSSRWPIVAIWQAHRAEGPDRFDGVRAALAMGRGEAARVWRDEGWRTRVDTITLPDAAFTTAMLDGVPLGAALDRVAQGHGEFDFEAWLVQALQQRWLVEVRLAGPSSSGDSR